MKVSKLVTATSMLMLLSACANPQTVGSSSSAPKVSPTCSANLSSSQTLLNGATLNDVEKATTAWVTAYTSNDYAGMQSALNTINATGFVEVLKIGAAIGGVSNAVSSCQTSAPMTKPKKLKANPPAQQCVDAASSLLKSLQNTQAALSATTSANKQAIIDEGNPAAFKSDITALSNESTNLLSQVSNLSFNIQPAAMQTMQQCSQQPTEKSKLGAAHHKAKSAHKASKSKK